MFNLCSDALPNIIGRAKNHPVLFIYRVILCTQAYNFFLLRSIKNNAGMFLKLCIQGCERTLQTYPLFLLTNLTWPFQR